MWATCSNVAAHWAARLSNAWLWDCPGTGYSFVVDLVEIYTLANQLISHKTATYSADFTFF
jgi:hypothetical protein